MTDFSKGVYSNALVAVFEAAFVLGIDPYALAVQAKIDVAKYFDPKLKKRTKHAERVITESLISAKLMSESRPFQQMTPPDGGSDRSGQLSNDDAIGEGSADFIGGDPNRS